LAGKRRKLPGLSVEGVSNGADDKKVIGGGK
jgi:hypothetical protein